MAKKQSQTTKKKPSPKSYKIERLKSATNYPPADVEEVFEFDSNGNMINHTTIDRVNSTRINVDFAKPNY